MSTATLDRFREAMFAQARKAGERSTALYMPNRLSGADPIDGERWRLVAKAFRQLSEGWDLKDVITDLRIDWLAFCRENNAKVADAPKLTVGPRAGQSSIEYKFASPTAIDGSIIFINQCVVDAKGV